jgi:cysteinyl-tRNA synthetase
MDEVFGLGLLKKEEINITKEVKKLAEQREKARKEKNWKEADRLREEITKKGYILEDTLEGIKIKKI